MPTGATLETNENIVSFTVEDSKALKQQILDLAKQQNEYMKRKYSTKYSKYNYKVQQTRSLHYYTYAMIWIYFLLASLYLGVLFVGPNRNYYSFSYKFFILLFLVLYPFLITPFEYLIFRAFVFITETIVGNVFTRDDHEYVIDQSYFPDFFAY